MSPTRPLLLVAAGVLGLTASAGVVPAAQASAPRTATSLVLSTVESSYGQTVTATAQVTSSAGDPQGDVVFSVDNLSIKANLAAGGVATIVLPRLPVGSHPVVATFVPQFPEQQAASASPPAGWVVEQVRTRLQLQVTGRRTAVRTTVRAQVDGDFGTRPSGRVRVVLHRTGTSRAVRVVAPVGATGLAVASLGRLPRGAYRAVVTYTGDEQHLRQRRVERFRVGGA